MHSTQTLKMKQCVRIWKMVTKKGGFEIVTTV